MKAKVIKPFKGAPDGQLHAIDFAKGDVVEGELAEVAVDQGWAREMPEPAPEPKPAATPTPNVGGAKP